MGPGRGEVARSDLTTKSEPASLRLFLHRLLRTRLCPRQSGKGIWFAVLSSFISAACLPWL
jgi:hypothetical protein